MSVKLNTLMRNYILDTGIAGVINSGYLTIYSGAAPASAQDAATGTLLVTIDTTITFSAAVAGVMSLSASATGVAVETDTAGYGRLTDNGSTYCIQGTVSTTAGDFILNTLSIIEDATITLVTCDITQPAS